MSLIDYVRLTRFFALACCRCYCIRSKANEEPQGWLDIASKAVINVASLLPPVNQVVHQWRSFANARLPFCGLKNVCAVTYVQRVPRVLVASADGYLYIYDFNQTDGGECTLIKQHKLDDPDEEVAPSAPGKWPRCAYLECHSVCVFSVLSLIAHAPHVSRSPPPPPRPHFLLLLLSVIAIMCNQLR